MLLDASPVELAFRSFRDPAKLRTETHKKLQKKVLDVDEKVIACRPADLLSPELNSIEENLESLSHEMHFDLMSGESKVDDVLTYALFLFLFY